MRAVLLTSPTPSQYALSRRLAREVNLVGLVLSRNEVPKRSPRRDLVNRLSGRLVGRGLRDAWLTAQSTLASRHGVSPPIEPLEVPEVNDSATAALLRDRKPDLVLVSGTNLVRDEILQLSSQGAGMVNLHTGISPWVKGGPNCTNWCLARGWFHLIGSSVMWLDLGVDSGDLIATERTPLEGGESLSELHTAVLGTRARPAYPCSRAAPGWRPTSPGPAGFSGDRTYLQKRRVERSGNASSPSQLRPRVSTRRVVAAPSRAGSPRAKRTGLTDRTCHRPQADAPAFSRASRLAPRPSQRARSANPMPDHLARLAGCRREDSRGGAGLGDPLHGLSPGAEALAGAPLRRSTPNVELAISPAQPRGQGR